MQYADEALEEQQHSNGQAEEELASERRPAYVFLKLAPTMMGTDEGRDDRDHDDHGQFAEVAFWYDEEQNRR